MLGPGAPLLQPGGGAGPGAGLVGRALTNRQIPSRLGRSPHTVNYHLRLIYQKLAITSRVELAEPLDLDLLRLGCDPLAGAHDFSAFCRRPKRRDGVEASLVRGVRLAGWSDMGDGVLRCELVANAVRRPMMAGAA